MDSERATASELALVVWDDREGTALDQVHVEIPTGLDLDGVRWFVEQRFGPVHGSAGPAGGGASPGSGVSAATVGWTLPVEAVPELACAHPGATTLIVVPFSRGPEGTVEELAHRDGRLADERPVLRTATRAGITFQVGGWLRRMLVEGHTYLLLEVGDDIRYVQFVTHDGSWLRGEVVGSVQVPDRPLTAGERAAILDVGWHPPTGQPSDGPGGVNHWMEWGDPVTDNPVDVQDAAELAAATLRNAFGVRATSQVRVETGTSRPAHRR